MAKYQRPNPTNSFLQASGDCIGTGIYGNGLVFDNQRYPFQVDGMPMQPPAANSSQYKPQPGLPRHTISRAAIRRERRIQHPQQQQQQQHQQQQQQQPPTPRTPQAMSRFPSQSQSQSPFVSQQLKRQQQQQTPIRQERVQQQQGEQQEQQEEQQQQQQQQLPTLQQQQLQLQQQLLQFQQQQLQRQQELQRQQQQQQQMYGSWPFGRNPMCSNTQAFPNNPLSQVYNYGANPLSSSFWPGYTMITSPDASIPFAFGLGPTDVNEITNTIL